MQILVDTVANGMLAHSSSQLLTSIKGELDDGT